jgi:hypothetical protein
MGISDICFSPHFITATAVLHFSGTSKGKIMIEGPGVNQDTVTLIIQESMVDAGMMYLKDVPVVVEAAVGNWWEK